MAITLAPTDKQSKRIVFPYLCWSVHSWAWCLNFFNIFSDPVNIRSIASLNVISSMGSSPPKLQDSMSSITTFILLDKFIRNSANARFPSCTLLIHSASPERERPNLILSSVSCRAHDPPLQVYGLRIDKVTRHAGAHMVGTQHLAVCASVGRSLFRKCVIAGSPRGNEVRHGSRNYICSGETDAVINRSRTDSPSNVSNMDPPIMNRVPFRIDIPREVSAYLRRD
ncbi:hypothetical protein B0H13DRAFT_1885275 [Mycena leptocephala]|nr:hypothetical protein B0H13DRAFT_1885275 [Mycena leptocephala]